MEKVNLGLVGYGVVGSGVVKLLQQRRNFIRTRYSIDFNIKSICDRRIYLKKNRELKGIRLTKNFNEILTDKEIDVVVELIGGTNPAEEVVLGAIKNGKHVVTANKELLAQCGRKIFREAELRKRDIYFEASVGAGIPIIKCIREGLAGNKFNALYGIITW